MHFEVEADSADEAMRRCQENIDDAIEMPELGGRTEEKNEGCIPVRAEPSHA